MAPRQRKSQEPRANPEKERPEKVVTAAYLERKAAILSAAGAVFYEQSYHAASMQDIADRAGVLKAGLYYYFKSKEDLLFELVAGENVRAFIEDLATCDDALRDQDMKTRLEAFITRWLEAIDPHPAFIAAEREYRHLSPQRLQTAIVLRRRVHTLIRDIIQRGIEEGSVDPGIVVPVTVMSISILLSNVDAWYRPTGPCTMQEVTDWHIGFILRGLGVHDA